MPKFDPKRLPGKWTEGFALDDHTVSSLFIGYDEFGREKFDTKRTDIGELLYQLKYKSDKAAMAGIVEAACAFLSNWKPAIDIVVPVPPSKRYRKFQPDLEIAKAVCRDIQIPLASRSIIKIKETAELKNIYVFDERHKMLEDVFAVKGNNLSDKSVLLMDDLFRSGATMNAITELLISTANVANVYALAITKTKSRQ